MTKGIDENRCLIGHYFLCIFCKRYNLFNFNLFLAELPQKRDIKIESGIKIEASFEHLNWLSNAIVLCLRVIDLGEATFCDASLMLQNLPFVSLICKTAFLFQLRLLVECK